MSAEHPQPPRPGSQPPDGADLAPYASTAGNNQYSPTGQIVQETNFAKGLLRNRHWYNRLFGWVVVGGVLLAFVGGSLWGLVVAFR